MSLHLFITFLGVSLVVIMTPGPDTAMTIRNTLFGGRAGGILTALGIATGQTIWAFATSIGIVALLVASAPLFLAIKYAGAAYLIYLGVQALRMAFRRQLEGKVAAQSVATLTRPLRARDAFRQGVVSDLGNPKMAVFFASLLPQFVPSGGANFISLMSLGLIFALLTFAWLVLYAAVIARAGHFLQQPGIRRVLEGVTGTLLIALGIRIAVEQR